MAKRQAKQIEQSLMQKYEYEHSQLRSKFENNSANLGR